MKTHGNRAISYKSWPQHNLSIAAVSEESASLICLSSCARLAARLCASNHSPTVSECRSSASNSSFQRGAGAAAKGLSAAATESCASQPCCRPRCTLACLHSHVLGINRSHRLAIQNFELTACHLMLLRGESADKIITEF